MKVNMGKADRIIRTVFAIFIAVLLLSGALKGVWAVILGVFAVVFLITSSVAFCPLYTLMGINTCKVGNKGAGGSPSSF